MFDMDDAQVILSIPLSRRNCSDRLIWHFDPKSCYTFKSGYMMAMDFVHGSVASVFYHSLQFVEFWKKFWHAKGHWKVKIHAWKACKTILPIVSRMQSRRVYLSNGCYF